MTTSTDEFWWIQLDEAADARRQPSFHAFAEGVHSDIRGQVIRLPAGADFSLPHDRWPHHLSVVIGSKTG